MRTVKTLKPGQKGARELLARFGPSLLCVRYHYDEARRAHVKTVGLVVQRRPRERVAECSGLLVPVARTPGAARRVALRIGWRERDLQRRVMSAGGRWDPDRRVWILKRDAVERLDSLGRVVGGGG